MFAPPTISRCWFRECFAILLVVLLSSLTFAQAANDNCADAIAITPGSVAGNTSGSNSDGEENCAAASDSPSVWYSYTPTEDSLVNVSTCPGATYDTALAVYSGCPGTFANLITCNDDACGLQSGVAFQGDAGETYLIRVSGFSGESGNFTLLLSATDIGSVSGPDVVYSDCTDVFYWGSDGTTHGYSLGSNTCNIGDQNLEWDQSSPLLAMNAYRLHDGRIEQIGMSWLKNATFAAAGSGPCGICNGAGGSVLGAGCLDIYSSGFNGGSFVLGPRSQCNAFTGSYPGPSGTINNNTDKRLQIEESDLGTPGALYFIEGVYVAADDAAAGNAGNNASYRRVQLGAGFDLDLQDTMEVGLAAIYAWRDYGGGGPGNPDPAVEIQEVTVPDEGTFVIGSKVTDLGAGSYRYDYAVFNLNSHRSGGSLSIPIPAGAQISDVGFHDVDYHTGEPYDNTDWDSVVGTNSIVWSSPETFAENQNSNALRFGTLYNFWFTADVQPSVGSATLGLFRPGTPSAISFDVPLPEGTLAGPEFVRGDCNNDGDFNIADPIVYLNVLFQGAATPSCLDACDMNDDGASNIADAISALDVLFGSLTSLPSPFLACGTDPTSDSIDCVSFNCP